MAQAVSAGDKNHAHVGKAPHFLGIVSSTTREVEVAQSCFLADLLNRLFNVRCSKGGQNMERFAHCYLGVGGSGDRRKFFLHQRHQILQM